MVKLLRACARNGAPLLLTALLAASCGGGGEGSGGGGTNPRFAAPEDCASCHPRQYAEWRGSMMAYAGVSPVFNALEAMGNSLTDGALAKGGSQGQPCQRCHSPVGIAEDMFPTFEEMEGRPSRDFMEGVASRGMSCDVCHQISDPDLHGSLEGDGIANTAFLLTPGDLKYGPIANAADTPRHETRKSDYLSSSQFCGSCHDVRLEGTDARTGEKAKRLENAFTEWATSVYATDANPYGRVVSCQDCHMSAYPYAAPGTYFQDYAAYYGEAPIRRVSTHYFTGVDIAFIEGFPGQSGQGTDGHGIPASQDTRRRDLLRAACELDVRVDEARRSARDGGGLLPLVVEVTNSGAGHNVPTGFSQERQVWIEITVTDAEGTLLYESGYLRDKAHPETGEMVPDGNLDDEDLENLLVTIDAATMEADIAHGPDHDDRPDVNRGLVNFGNEFHRIEDDGAAEEVFFPFLANHMDNSHSIPPLATAEAPYDIELPADVVWPVNVDVRLRFRAFPPRFLRALAAGRPDLVSEDIVDRNRVVDMAEASLEVY
jgi:hypothetical protein